MAININIPSFQKDKYYDMTQKDLFGFGSGLLSGDIPDYYGEIGEYGGSAFNDFLKMIQRDTTKAVTEDAARRNVGSGGAISSSIAKATADAGTKLRWQDYLNAMQGRKFLLGAGLDILSGVRSGALTNQSQNNQFALNKANLELGQEKFNALLEQEQEAAESNKWSKLLSSGIGVAGQALGFYLGGLPGSMAGKTTADAVTKKLGLASGKSETLNKVNIFEKLKKQYALNQGV